MLLIVQPAFIDLNFYYITPIVFCIFFACVAISVRSLSKTEPNYRIAFYFTFLCTILGLATTFKGDWVLPSKIDLVIFTIMGLCGSVANLLLTQSYRMAEASLVTPIKYLSLVFAIVFGFFIWSEIPKILTLFGALLVIASSLIIFMRENKLKKANYKSKSMSKSPIYWNKAKKILVKKDKVMAKLISNYKDGFLITRNDVFFSLCKSIIGQQISVAAANSVFKKFEKNATGR